MSDSDNLRLSFEFFPPKTEQGRTKLAAAHQELAQCEPEFFSVTYGAGGSTRDNTLGSVKAIQAAGSSVAPHLSFGGDDDESMIALLNEYKDLGIDRIVALRGDMPSGMGGAYQMVYANQLIEFIRKHTGDHFHLEVAAYPEIHPEAKSFDSDIEFLKQKFDAGANSAITQYFYNADAYFYFIESCLEAGITQPIYPGIMPISNYHSLSRFSMNCGAEIPRWMRKRLEAFGDDQESIKAFGLDVITELSEVLLENDAPGLHIYTMNNAEPTMNLMNELGLLPGE
ncbi:methylenetetrahydrofolate reductase [NAD(P)H] [Marinagarivorans algicola]|uniref:methylenetetrahydrofolate reductase [NAD(P)H] n=1 Tax=Marinagarivorans algicola TaxID=1513270 RepID=UPI0006B9D6F2|nr:methylenetetrahydrofolate reductase [NAD(P)H] [Marinagarivorans algicola]